MPSLAAISTLALVLSAPPATPAPPPRLTVERPRLFVPPARLATIEARARGGLERIYREQVKKDCDATHDERRLEFTVSNSSYLLSRTLSLLLCARIERDPAYSQKALALSERVIARGQGGTKRDQRVRLQALAITYDWLHDSLSSKERERLRGAIVSLYQTLRGALSVETEFVSGHSHFTTASLIVALLALCDGTGELEAELERALLHWRKYLDVARKVGADGGHHLGWMYGRSYASRTAWVLEAIRTATGQDLFVEERPWLSQLGWHFVYGMRPDNTYFRVGDTHRDIRADLDQDVVLLGILAERFREAHFASFAARTLAWSSEHRAVAPDSDFVYALLFLDPALETPAPASLPLVRGFAVAGNYTFRTGWGPDDTAVLLRAMPWYHLNHVHRDFGSFLVYQQGGLAVHGGAYQAGDDDSDYGGPHLRNFAWRTVAHNTITVLDPGERFCAPTGPGNEACRGDNLWSNDGGQKIRSTLHDDVPVPFFQPRNAAELDDPRFAQGSVPVFEDRPELAYVLADGTRAYRADKVKLFERHFFFLKKVSGARHPVIVIFDRVTSTRPELKKTWRLHTLETPVREGNVFVIENRGRVRFSGDLAAKPGDYWQAYSGRLFSETLLPANARLEFVGGEGKECWVDGRNYPAGIREVDRIVEPSIGRIEVSPAIPRATDLFLHVLSPRGIEDASPKPDARLLESNADAALRVSDHVIIFPSKEARGARITYEVVAAGPLLHTIVAVDPSMEHQVFHDGLPFLLERSSRGGVLVFRTPGGGAFYVEGPPK